MSATPVITVMLGWRYVVGWIDVKKAVWFEQEPMYAVGITG